MRRRRFAEREGELDSRRSSILRRLGFSGPWVSSPPNSMHQESSVSSAMALRVLGKRSRLTAISSDVVEPTWSTRLLVESYALSCSLLLLPLLLNSLGIHLMLILMLRAKYTYPNV